MTDDEVIATAALAGWRFVENQSSTQPSQPLWDTYSPSGAYHGFNFVLAKAARYALGVMQSECDDRDGRQGQRMKHDPAADQNQLLADWERKHGRDYSCGLRGA